MDDNQLLCDLCGKPVSQRDWVGLNRWVVSGVRSVQMLTGDSCDGYVWDHDTQAFSGYALCYPECLHQWIDAQLVELSARPDG